MVQRTYQRHPARIFSPRPAPLIAELSVRYEDGTEETVRTDESWSVRKSRILFSDIYDGEVYDASLSGSEVYEVRQIAFSKDTLIPQEGEIICEQERLKPLSLIVSPNGERIIDFGQNFAGYVELSVDAPAKTRIVLSHAEILDKDGNFLYRELP